MVDLPTVRAIDVTKSFGRRRRSGANVLAVNGVSLEIPSRSTFGLIGESGSGKSTFARCLLRLVDVDSGSVELEGIDSPSCAAGRCEVSARECNSSSKIRTQRWIPG